jgi:HEAT repeat protein
MWELCAVVANSSESESRDALLEMVNEGIIEEGCQQAVRDGLAARSSLGWCYDSLSSSDTKKLFDSLADELNEKEHREVLCEVAAARAAIEARILVEHGGTILPLLQWSARASGRLLEKDSWREPDYSGEFVGRILPPACCNAKDSVAVAFDRLRGRGVGNLEGRRRILEFLNGAEITPPQIDRIEDTRPSKREHVELRSLMAVVHEHTGWIHHVWDLLPFRRHSSPETKDDLDSSDAHGELEASPDHEPHSWIDVITDEHLTSLTGLLRSNDARICHEAMILVWQLASEIAPFPCAKLWQSRITPELLTALAAHFTNPIDSERHRAVSAAGAFAVVRTHPAVQEGLVPLLNDPADAVRAAAAAALTLSCPTSSALIARLAGLLDDHSSAVRSVAAQCLAHLELDASVQGLTGALERALASPDTSALANVLAAVGNLRPAAPPELISVVRRFLHDPIANIRAAAASAVVRSGDSAATEEVCAALIQLLDDPDGKVRAAVASAIGAFGMAAPSELREGLGRMVLDQDETVIKEVAAATQRIGRVAATQELLDRIAFLLRQEEGPLLIGAVRGLGSAAATPAIEVALARMFCTCPEAFTGAEALGRKGFRRTLAHFAGLFRDPVRRVRDQAVRAAMTLRGTLAIPDFLDEVVQLLRDENADTRATVAGAVEAIGPPASTPAIREALDELREDAESYVRYKAKQAIRAIAPDADVD